MDDRMGPGTPPDGDPELDQVEDRRRRWRDNRRRQRAAMPEAAKATKRKEASDRERRRRAGMTEEQKAAQRKKPADRERRRRDRDPGGARDRLEAEVGRRHSVNRFSSLW